MTENVFKIDSTQTHEANQQQIENYLEHYVGEGKKFKDVQELAKGKYEADNYIPTLEKKLDELRSELEKRQTAAEIADQIRSRLADTKSTEVSNQGNTNLGETTQDDQTTTKGLSQEDIEKLLEERISQREKQSKAQQNIAEVSRVLNERVGATSNKWLQDKANELGVTVQYLQQQAEVSPKAFYNLVGLNTGTQQRQGFNPPASSVNTASSLDSGSQVRNNAYYEKMFNENPKLRFDPKITVQMHKDAQRLGLEKFYST